MKKLMVLGAGAPQVCLIEAAKRRGYRTVVCSIPGNYPGFAHADETAYYDISDPEQVLAAAREFRVDGIATCCLDTGVRALGYACEKLGFPGLSEEAAVRSADKWQMKKAFAAAGVNTARFIQIESREALDAAVDELGLPVVVKAVDLQGSKGVYICRSREEAAAAFEGAMALTRRGYLIVEEFISGNELGAQAFVYQGEILFILPHGDNTYMSKTAVPIGHYVPLDAPDAVLEAAKIESEKAIRAIGLDNCAVNIDLLERDGKVYLIELTGRAGATGTAYTLIGPDDAENIANIEKLTGSAIPVFGQKDVRVALKQRVEDRGEEPEREPRSESRPERAERKPVRSPDEQRAPRREDSAPPRRAEHRREVEAPVPPGEWNGPRPDFLGVSALD